jgi:hypothetical protein
MKIELTESEVQSWADRLSRAASLEKELESANTTLVQTKHDLHIANGLNSILVAQLEDTRKELSKLKEAFAKAMVPGGGFKESSYDFPHHTYIGHNNRETKVADLLGSYAYEYRYGDRNSTLLIIRQATGLGLKEAIEILEGRWPVSRTIEGPSFTDEQGSSVQGDD